MEKEGGNRERMRKCRESISLHFLIFSPFPPHFLILSPFPLHFLILSLFPRSPAARLQPFVQPWFYPRRQSAFVFTPVLTSLRRLNKFFEGGAASVVSVLPREPIYSSWADDPSLAPLPLTTPITTKH